MICSKCKIEKEPQEFNRSKKTKTGYHAYCRECHKGHYRQNSVRYVENARKRKKAYKQEVINYLRSFLTENPCAKCGEDDIVVLEFDHLKDKTMPVGSLIRAGYPLKRIQEEVAKCQVLCANCHRRKTSKENKWWRG